MVRSMLTNIKDLQERDNGIKRIETSHKKEPKIEAITSGTGRQLLADEEARELKRRRQQKKRRTRVTRQFQEQAEASEEESEEESESSDSKWRPNQVIVPKKNDQTVKIGVKEQEIKE